MIKYLEEQYPREACGVEGLDYEGNTIFFPCRNNAIEDDDFEMDSIDYIKALIQCDTVLYIVHSHPDASPNPSFIDIKTCNFLNIAYKIISLPDKEEFILNPGDLNAE